MTPEIPESAVRLEAAGAGLEFVMDRHAYLVLDAAVRSEVFPGRAPLAEVPARRLNLGVRRLRAHSSGHPFARLSDIQ
jgi:hypothetical protein